MIFFLTEEEWKPTLQTIQILIEGCRCHNILHLWKKERVREKPVSVALNINVRFVALPLQYGRLLWWSHSMTEITYVQNPMRQLIDNAWNKNVFVYSQIWFWGGGSHVFFLSLETWFTGLKWVETGVRRSTSVSRPQRLALHVPTSRRWWGAGLPHHIHPIQSMLS